MLTHYVRRLKPPNKPLGGPLQSLLLQIVPADKLVVQDEVLRSFHDYCTVKSSEVRGLPRNKQDVCGALNTLVEQGFVREVNGTRLSRWLDTF